MADDDFLNLREASQQLGISVTTLRRKVSRGQMSARITVIPSGERWEISRSEIEKALLARDRASGLETLHGGPPGAPPSSGDSPRGPGESPKISRGGSPVGPPSSGDPGAVVAAALALSNRLLDELAAERQGRILDRQLAEREQRRIESLSMELQSYKRVLGEQAQSLAEERAMRLAAEQKADVAVPPLPESPMNILPSPVTKRNSGGWSRFKGWLGLKTETG
jgi:hypothetical protein